MDSHDKKLKFILEMTKHGLSVPHFDGGGLIGNIGSVLGINSNFNANAANITPGTNANQLADSYGTAKSSIGQAQDISARLTPGVQLGADTQNTIANQLSEQALGTGPTVAGNALNQATGANIASTAATMAGARGAGGNVGLIARQAAQQGANTQQQAAGQAATLRAQEVLGAQNAGANLAAQRISEAQGANQNAVNATQGEQGILQGANSAYNTANVSNQSNANTVNSATAKANADMNSKTLSNLSGALPGIGSLVGGGGGASASGAVAPMQLIGMVAAKGGNVESNTEMGPMSHVGKYLKTEGKLMESGGKVKAGSKKEKAAKKGDSYDNDKIPAMLSEGEIVLPRHVTMHPQAPEMAAEFVRKTLAKKGLQS